MALNTLIHLLLNQPSPVLTAGIDYIILLLLSYLACLKVPEEFSHSGIASLSLCIIKSSAIPKKAVRQAQFI